MANIYTGIDITNVKMKPNVESKNKVKEKAIIAKIENGIISFKNTFLQKLYTSNLPVFATNGNLIIEQRNSNDT